MPPAPRDDKPQAIIHATRILWVWTLLSFAYGVYSSWINLPALEKMMSEQTQGMAIIEHTLLLKVTIGSYGFLAAGAAWVIWKIGAGKNWARLSLLLSFILDAVWTAIPPYHGIPYFLEALPDLGAQIAALYLLYTWPGRAWFLPPGTTAA